mmetsp:Transcript_32198/g.44154  ORF Transcript_32198/g.44154 Transcript_32198/m.44154 type:complete len:551 (-) Transcript_32198:29-1681(-)|eukprot:CAMPEP_0201475480 /NCGR_PEP_ID=MMETSP0151_2-20130828/904_1 /ASSEMBLY_ACC=CAM_ASM_000257 /TAXON_ID=200890 /ORGANISM="Paramoeba atlantica, Strain 621/1 / CCAP 1560/9" /LENGTH=550 /DNA_ID=CAMNT_0047855589 /DNA_START=176 /DNA_END=1828 /DNA_ORIENTATION=-
MSEQVPEKLRVLGIGGLSKSHCLAMLPVIEELAARGHEVTFLLPDTEDGRAVGSDEMKRRKILQQVQFEFRGEPRIPFRSDMRTSSWLEILLFFGNMWWTADEILENALFVMDDATTLLLQREKFDVVVTSMSNLGGRKAATLAGVPLVNYTHAPLILDIFCSDYNHNIRFPGMASGLTQEDLKNSFRKCVWNQVTHILLSSFFQYAIVPSFRRIVKKRYNENHPEWKMSGDTFVGTWAGTQHMVLGGVPFTSPLPRGFSSHIHVLGVVNKQQSSILGLELQQWLDESSLPVVYVSMGTVYVYTEKSIRPLLAATLALLKTNSSIRVLWSLQEKIRNEFKDLIEFQTIQQSYRDQVRFENFPPQPELLAHPAVKVFLSHCGMGGMSDTMAAGTPVLAFPTMGDQKSNAVAIIQAKAGILLKDDFSDLKESTLEILEHWDSYHENMLAMKRGMDKYGGLFHAIKVIEEAGKGNFIEEEEELREAREKIDPYFEENSQWEARLVASVLIFCFLGFFVPLIIFLFAIAFPFLLMKWCCCGSASPKETPKKKEQ